MLILTRRVGEGLQIGGEDGIKCDGPIMVDVLGVKGNQVRIGVTAESAVEVHRHEIAERIRHERAKP